MSDGSSDLEDPKQTAEPEVAELIVSAPRAAARARWVELFFLLMLCAYSLMAILAHTYAYFEWDLKLARGIQSISIPGFSALMIGVSILGNGWMPTVLVVMTGVLLIWKGVRLEGLMCLYGAGLGWVVTQFLKFLIGRPRPSDLLVNVSGHFHFQSFPSGHVVFFMEFFGFLLFLAHVLLERGVLRGTLRIILAFLILMVGMSRVYLGAHWPSDVVGAYLAGGIWLMLMITVYRRLKEKQRVRPVPEKHV